MGREGGSNILVFVTVSNGFATVALGRAGGGALRGMEKVVAIARIGSLWTNGGNQRGQLEARNST